jgi:hypothetical protein
MWKHCGRVIFLLLTQEINFLTLYRLNFFYIIYTNAVRTSQETHHVTATKPNWLTLFRETVDVLL